MKKGNQFGKLIEIPETIRSEHEKYDFLCLTNSTKIYLTHHTKHNFVQKLHSISELC